MNNFASGCRVFVFLVVGFVFSAAVLAQDSGQSSRTPKRISEVPTLTLKGSEPKPLDATKAIIAAFDKYQVVGMGAAHGDQDLDHFILDLVRNPALRSKVNDVVVECGNSLYQPILDRYIAGDDVPLDQARKVWRNTTQPMCWISGFYEELFPLIRRINQKVPQEKRIRVLAGDPPIEWGKVKTREDFWQFLTQRDSSIASVMEKEVLSKHHKALMLFGAAHLYHGGGHGGFTSAVQLYEERYPGVTMVVESGNLSLRAGYNAQFESRAASWPIPSLVSNLTGTWLADWLDKTRNPEGLAVVISKTGQDGKRIVSPAGPQDKTRGFSKKVDAYLYLGPQELLLKEPRPAEIFLNKDYMAEVQRRAAIIGPGPITDQAKAETVSDRDYDPFLYDQITKTMATASRFQPATMPPVSAGHTEVEVNPRLFDGYVGKYGLAPGIVLTITRERDRLFAQVNKQPLFQMFAESEREFFLKAVDAQITFVTDAQGRATELILHQDGDHVAKRIE